MTLDPLETALERYHSAETLLEQHQARLDVDAVAIDREALRKVRAAVLRGDEWMIEKVRTLVVMPADDTEWTLAEDERAL